MLAQHLVEKILVGATVPLTLVKRSDDLLSSLVGNINGATGRFVMHLGMKMVASLSEHPHNKEAMFAFPGLVESVLLVGSTHMYEVVRDESARIIMNLALETKNKVRLVQGNDQRWLGAVLVLARGSVASKAYAIQTLGSLATMPECKTVLVQHCSGAVVGALLRVASARSSQPQVSVNATRILGNLASQATAAEIASHPGLLVSLSSLALRDDKLAVAAAMTVKKLATFCRSSDSCHKDLLSAVVTMSYGRSTEVLKWTGMFFI